MMTGDTNNFGFYGVLVVALLKETLVDDIHLADFKLEGAVMVGKR